MGTGNNGTRRRGSREGALIEIKLAGREMPRNANGDVRFSALYGADQHDWDHSRPVMEVFSKDEVVELVNRAIYQLEYQAAAHRKRGQAERARMKALKEELGKAK